MTEEELATIESRQAYAANGPLVWGQWDGRRMLDRDGESVAFVHFETTKTKSTGEILLVRDVQRIIAEDVPALVAEVRRLQKELHDLKVDEAYRRVCEL